VGDVEYWRSSRGGSTEDSLLLCCRETVGVGVLCEEVPHSCFGGGGQSKILRGLSADSFTERLRTYEGTLLLRIRELDSREFRVWEPLFHYRDVLRNPKGIKRPPNEWVADTVHRSVNKFETLCPNRECAI
jgi:hypothetical protein